jgi:antitoxin component YwqK of YwqJK toxin-antitoxin module
LAYSEKNGAVESVRFSIPATGLGLEAHLEDGGITSVEFLKDGLSRGAALTWHGGKLVTSASTDAAGRSSGVFHTFYDDGTIMSERVFVQGEQHGHERRWFPSGELKLIGKYDRGWPAGEFVEFFKNGDIEQVTEYFPRSNKQRDLLRPWHVARRCSPGAPLVDIVSGGAPVDGVRACPVP